MAVGRSSKLLRGVGVIAMLNAGLDTMQHVEVPQVGGVVHLLVTGVLLGVFIDRLCVAGGVEVTHWLISAQREVFSENEGMEF
jgi:hypothetical protein